MLVSVTPLQSSAHGMFYDPNWDEGLTSIRVINVNAIES